MLMTEMWHQSRNIYRVSGGAVGVNCSDDGYDDSYGHDAISSSSRQSSSSGRSSRNEGVGVEKKNDDRLTTHPDADVQSWSPNSEAFLPQRFASPRDVRDKPLQSPHSLCQPQQMSFSDGAYSRSVSSPPRPCGGFLRPKKRFYTTQGGECQSPSPQQHNRHKSKRSDQRKQVNVGGMLVKIDSSPTSLSASFSYSGLQNTTPSLAAEVDCASAYQNIDYKPALTTPPPHLPDRMDRYRFPAEEEEEEEEEEDRKLRIEKLPSTSQYFLNDKNLQPSRSYYNQPHHQAPYYPCQDPLLPLQQQQQQCDVRATEAPPSGSSVLKVDNRVLPLKSQRLRLKANDHQSSRGRVSDDEEDDKTPRHCQLYHNRLGSSIDDIAGVIVHKYGEPVVSVPEGTKKPPLDTDKLATEAERFQKCRLSRRDHHHSQVEHNSREEKSHRYKSKEQTGLLPLRRAVLSAGHEGRRSTSGSPTLTADLESAETPPAEESRLQSTSSCSGGAVLDSSSRHIPEQISERLPSDERSPSSLDATLFSPRPSRGQLTRTHVPKKHSIKDLCVICGDKASGYHYNTLSCEGCKGFFRRTITRSLHYQCKYGGNCQMDMWMRRKCPACRLKRCKQVGMREECLLTEHQCIIRNSKRKLKMKLKKDIDKESDNQSVKVTEEDSILSSKESVDCCNPDDVNDILASLNDEHRQMIERLVELQDRYELPSSDDLKLLLKDKMFKATNDEDLSDAIFVHMVEMTILVTRLIVEFAKSLPGFRNLVKEDQIILLKASSSEVMMLRTARRYDPESNTIVFGNGVPFSPTSMTFGGLQESVQSMFDFSRSMSSLYVDNTEYALLTAMCIFSVRAGLTNPMVVDKLQEVYMDILLAYVGKRRPKCRSFLAKLLMMLVQLRTVGHEHSQTLYSLTLKRGTFPPLLTEYFDIVEPCEAPK